MESVYLDALPLILRAVRMDDAPAIYDYIRDADVYRNTLNIPNPYEDGMAEEWLTKAIQQWEDKTDYAFAITHVTDDRLIGVIGLHVTARHQRAEVGYWIGEPFRNKGYTTLALKAVLRFGFEALTLHRIQATYFPANPASRRVMEKAGMTYEGMLRGYVVKEDTPRDIGMCAILRDEWANVG